MFVLFGLEGLWAAPVVKVHHVASSRQCCETKLCCQTNLSCGLDCSIVTPVVNKVSINQKSAVSCCYHHAKRQLNTQHAAETDHAAPLCCGTPTLLCITVESSLCLLFFTSCLHTLPLLPQVEIMMALEEKFEITLDEESE